MIKVLNLTSALILATLITGCGMISEQVTSEDSMLDKAKLQQAFLSPILSLQKAQLILPQMPLISRLLIKTATSISATSPQQLPLPQMPCAPKSPRMASPNPQTKVTAMLCLKQQENVSVFALLFNLKGAKVPFLAVSSYNEENDI